MNAFNIPRSYIVTLATLTLALALAAMPMGPAFAGEARISTLDGASPHVDQPAAMDVNHLRHLLSKSALNMDEQVQLDRAMDAVEEELADASQPQTNQSKGLIQSVNDLLGVKPKIKSQS